MGITVGSRGISKISIIVKEIVQFIKENGGYPYIISCMGSHGGGTVEGQLKILKKLGVTEDSVDAPISGCVNSELIGKTSKDLPVYCNQMATKMDQVIVVNRVKPHTDFEGTIESGLCKMMAIGLGGPKGARVVHANALTNGYEETIVEVASKMLNSIPVLFGMAIIENWKGRTMHIEAVAPKDVIEREKKLLIMAKDSTCRLPFDSLDVLVIKNMGKNISGTGMDTKVIGRIMRLGAKEPTRPRIKRVVVLGLTPESHGNATGIGLADFSTQTVLEDLDIKATALNSISSMSPEQGRLPCLLDNDYEAICASIMSIGNPKPENIRFVLIRNTLDMEVIAVSTALREEVRGNSRLQIISSPTTMHFSDKGRLLNFNIHV